MPAAPKWEQLAASLREQIRAGQLKPGDKLPTIKELCVEYGVSEIVVRNATIQLKAEGLIEGVPGVGVFVADNSST